MLARANKAMHKYQVHGRKQHFFETRSACPSFLSFSQALIGLLDFLSMECMEHYTRSLFCSMHSFFCFIMQLRICPSSFWYVVALTATANSAELG